MISKANLKLIRSLRQKKFRDMHGLFLVEGEKMVAELLGSSAGTRFGPRIIFATEDWMDGHRSLVGGSAEVVEAGPEEIRKVSNLVTPQPVIALVGIPESDDGQVTQLKGAALGFEAIRDPGNLGTIIRTADWFGIREIICSTDSVDQYNPKVVQATMGSLFRTRVRYMELEPLLEGINARGGAVYGTCLDGENLYETGLDKDPLILFGNESSGLSDSILPLLEKRISIPSSGNSGAESLNLASSVAVVCSEITRRVNPPIRNGN